MVCFIGAFDILDLRDNTATSAAGNQVQIEIIKELSASDGFHNAKIISVVMKPLISWPKGDLLWPGVKHADFIFPRFVNIAGLKRFIFSSYLLMHLFKFQPKLVVKYNITTIEAIVLIFYKFIFPSVFLTAIIQDVHYSKRKKFSFSGLNEWISLKLISFFDMLIPISEKIMSDFGLPYEKTRVFNGGLTRQSRSILNEKGGTLSPFAVFAGALENYNGIEILISQWISQNIDMKLHVFGKGSRESFVRNSSACNSNIIFHGFRSEEEVSSWQSKALINFCLRYSDGIDAGYFFPSKLFNVICAPGAVMANQFMGFPLKLQTACTILSSDLSDLSEKINTAKSNPNLESLRELRKQWITENANWKPVIEDMITRAIAKIGH